MLLSGLTGFSSGCLVYISLMLPWPLNLESVPNWASKNNFWVTELYGCSFQVPHASPRPRSMEVYFFYHVSYLPLFLSLKSSISCHYLIFCLLNVSSILLLELWMHIFFAILYYHLVFSSHSFHFHHTISFNSPTRVGDV